MIPPHTHSMPMEAVKIPQNVYVEDRIVGPLTLKQLIILGIGAGIGYTLYSLTARSGPVSVPLTMFLWSPAAIAAAFAFVRINDLNLFSIILLSLERLWKPMRRTWCPHQGISINIVTSTKEPTEALRRKQETDERHLKQLAHQLEERERRLSELSSPADHEHTPSAGSGSGTPTGDQAASQPEPLSLTPPLPVDPSRMRVSKREPHHSIDGLMPNLSAFSHIFCDHDLTP